jgi:hypothetical protein
MKYGVIASVSAIILGSLILLNSVGAFRSNNNQVPTDNTPVSPNNNQVPTDNTPVSPNNNQVPTDNTPVSPNNNQLTVIGQSTYTDSEGRFNIIGEVQNSGFKTLKFPRVTGTVHDPSNRIVATSSAYTSLQELGPQQKSNFHIVFSNQAPIDESTTYALAVSSSQSPAPPKSPTLLVNYGNVRVDSPDSFTFIGEVTNQGNRPANLVKVSASFYDVNNQLVDVENVYIQTPTLQPGESAPFEIPVVKSSNPLLAQINSASFNVQSNEASSASLSEKIIVGPAVTPTSPPTASIYKPIQCGRGTHLNERGDRCVREDRDQETGT